ncbi:MAG: holo-ACP synthase [Lachnospiraceae bacterium]|nr:holo-ACP synthase [Lachnospiraceae bacterium]MBQ6857396.1 holo-ACP synthase [Lachnospiraceae bacterium]
MLIGVGCDLIELERVKKACEKEAFLSRIYTDDERRQADGKISVLAGTFAVKESVAKVLGTGFREFMPIDVEVLRDDLGKPYVILHGNARRVAEEKGIRRLEVSISDTKEYVMAFAVGEGEA